MYSDLNIISFKMALAFLIIFILMLFFFFILKRMKMGNVYNNRYPVMKNIGTLALAPKRSIALIEVCDQWLLVGIGTENLTLISRLEKPSDGDTIESQKIQEPGRFDSLLEKARIFGKQNNSVINNKK